VLAEGASPPAPSWDGAAELPPPDAGAADPPVPPEAPADGAIVGPKVQPPALSAWAEHPCVATAAPSATASTIAKVVGCLRMTVRMGLKARRRARANPPGCDIGVTTDASIARRLDAPPIARWAVAVLTEVLTLSLYSGWCSATCLQDAGDGRDSRFPSTVQGPAFAVRNVAAGLPTIPPWSGVAWPGMSIGPLSGVWYNVCGVPLHVVADAGAHR